MDKDKLQNIEDRCKWRGRNKMLEWLYGNSIVQFIGLISILDSKEIENTQFKYIGVKMLTCVIDTSTLGQYVGRKDKTGCQIYEGDLVQLKNNGIHIAKVIYKGNRFVLVDTQNTTYEFGCFLDCELKIVGNIYDNKELY